MAQQTERVRKLVDGYMDYWRQGKSPKEIAEIFEVSDQTVYNRLQEIANKNGMKRDELLANPNLSVQKETKTTPFRRERIKGEELLTELALLKENIASAIKELDQILEDQ